ncbi:MAG: TonB family protein [Pyrinomonadaceae bacterium]
MRVRFFTRERAQDAVLALVILMLLAIATLPARAQSSQLSLADILIALRSKKADIGEKNKILAEAVKQRGITFSLTPEIEKELDGTGAANDLIAAIRQKMPAPPSTQMPVKPAPEVVKPVEDFAYFRSRVSDELKNGNTDAAFADLEKAIALDPKDAGVRHDHAMLLVQKNDLPAAAAEYSKASELAPDDVRNYIGRADVYERMGKLPDALADYQKVLTINPADKNAGAAVVRVSTALTKAVMDLNAKQAAPPVEKKSEPVSTPPTVTKEQVSTAQADPPKSEPATAVVEESKGPLNVGNLLPYCIDLVKPAYPTMAMNMRTTGDVAVAVTLDPNGNVVDAKATSGVATLRSAAELAARRSKFKPVITNGKPVKATGVMNYTFKL